MFLIQILEGLGAHARLMVSLYPTLMAHSKEDQDDEVCSNSIYALGILAANALPEMLRYGQLSKSVVGLSLHAWFVLR